MIEQLYDIFVMSEGVTTDTRKCEEGMMFFALKGASFNGNEFALQAVESGCVCAVVDDSKYADDPRCILVDDVLTTLQQLAAKHRVEMGRRGLKVLQITGTNGKTTTKELCAAVLSKKYNVLYTQGNLNNHIGVPLTLLRLRPEHQIAVIETGANHPGEIKTLTEIVQPDFGLITNVGRAHLEGFGGFEGVKRTKGELYDWLAAHNRPAFLLATNSDLVQMADERGLKTIPYNRAEALPTDDTLIARVVTDEVYGLTCARDVFTQLVGDYNLPNVQAAFTVGRYFGVDELDAFDAIMYYHPSNNRSQLMRTERNRLVVDAYNANPSSMSLALDNFSRMPGEHKMMIIGDMRELGAESETEHRRIVQQVVRMMDDGNKYPIEQAWLVGDNFAHVAEESATIRLFANVEEVKQALTVNPLSDCTILIKGSNGTRLFLLPEEL